MSSISIKIKGKIDKLSERDKSIFNNIIGAFTIKGLALILSLFTMPAYIRYFDNQQVLGLWFTMLSVLSWILTFDLGIGNGLRNNLVQPLVNKDNVKIKQYISSAYLCIGIVVMIVMILSTIIFKYINWNILLNIEEDIVSKEILNETVTIVFSGIMIQFLLKLITSILYAMQKSAITNLLSLLNSILILLYVLLSDLSTIEAKLISLAMVYILSVNIPLVVASIYVFTRDLKGCFPNIKFFKKEYCKNIMKLGGTFFWVQIMYMILTTTNEFLITWLVGSSMVVEYQIYNKLFTLIGTFFALALTPIWSSVTKAIVEEDYKWIHKLFKKLKRFALYAVFLEFAMIPFLQLGINIWLRESAIQVNYIYALIFAISGSIFIWNGVISSIANGFGRVGTQLICFTIGVLIKIPLSIILVKSLDSWIGIIIANIIAMSMYCAIEPIVINKVIRNEKLGEGVNV